jgi:UDP:flavonoid glycosyltransferase YjiC (YdhE family)
LTADFQKASAEELKAVIGRLLGDASYAEAARRLARKFVELQAQTPSLAIIESALTGRLNFHRRA